MTHPFRNIFSIAILASVVCSCALETPSSNIREEYVLNLKTNFNYLFEPGTRVDLKNSEDDIQADSINMFCWSGDDVTETKAGYSSGSWFTSPSYSIKKNESYKFFVYANLPADGVETPTCTKDSLKLKVTDITEAQEDILMGFGKIDNAASGDVDVNISHPYASVKLKIGNVAGLTSVSEITLSGLCTSGETALTTSSTEDAQDVMQYEWKNQGANSAKISMTGLSLTEGDSATFVVIPQDLSTNEALLVVKYNRGFLTKIIDSGSWKAGYTTVYTFGYVAEIKAKLTSTKTSTTISGVSMVNNSLNKVYMRASIAGAWYDSDGAIVAPWDGSTGFTGTFPGTGWTQHGDNYYYENAVDEEGGTPTAPLFESYTSTAAPVTGAHLELTVLVQAIPYDSTKSCYEAFSAL